MEYLTVILLAAAIFVFYLLEPKAGFIAFIFASSFDNFLYWDGLGFKVKIYQVFLLSGLFTFLMMNLLSKAKIKKDNLFFLLLLYWSCGFISLKNAGNMTDAFIILAVELISMLIYFLVIQTVRTEKLIINTLKAILLSGNFVALYGIFQVIGYNLGLKTQVMDTQTYSWGRPTGTFYESNYLGAYSLSIALILLSLLSSKLELFKKNYLRASLFLQLVSLILSMTRGAWAGLIFGTLLLGLLLVFTERRKRWGRLVYSVSLLLILSLVSVGLIASFSSTVSGDFLNRFSTFKSLDFKPDSYSTESVRLSKMSRAVEVIKSNFWVGYGPGQAGLYSDTFIWYNPEEEYLRRGAGASNFFLSILFQRGVLGLIILCSFLAIFFRQTLRALAKIEDDSMKVILRSIFIGFCGVFFTFMFTESHLLAFFWVQMGFIAAIRNFALAGQKSVSNSQAVS